MKRLSIAMAMLLSAIMVVADNDVIIDGIKYTLDKNNSVSCKAVEKQRLVDVQIPSVVKIGGLEFYVDKIAPEGFRKCNSLRSIDIPNSVKHIGDYAFNDCRNLESVVMPDEAVASVPKGTYGFGRYGIFKGCTKLADVRGQTVLYPRYVVYDAFYDCKEVPFYNTIVAEGSAKLTQMQLASTFSDFASARLKRAVEEWQRRKSYETIAQWESRVNDDSRKSMLDENLAALRLEYIAKYSPTTIKGKIGEYVRDFEFFPIELGSLGNVYASVPVADAPVFRERWNEVMLQPVYGIMDDNLSILSCTFSLDGKEYPSARSFVEDDFAPLAQNVTPLSAVKEYEQMLLKTNGNVESKKIYDADVIDINIPESTLTNEHTFAVIIGNENYQRVANVDFASNDARVFAKYCNRTLGIPETNIRSYFDATYGDILAAVRDIKEIASVYQGEIRVLFYYAGHGIPDESTRNAYLLPTDASGMETDACYPLTKLYEELGSLNANLVVAFIDACFSGSLRGDGMLASARGIRLKPRDIGANGNLVVISAASGEQTALPYEKKNHGMFTYYLLNKLNETAGNVTLGELADYVASEVARQSIVENRKLQTPTIKYSQALLNSWREMRF